LIDAKINLSGKRNSNPHDSNVKFTFHARGFWILAICRSTRNIYISFYTSICLLVVESHKIGRHPRGIYRIVDSLSLP